MSTERHRGDVQAMTPRQVVEEYIECFHSCLIRHASTTDIPKKERAYLKKFLRNSLAAATACEYFKFLEKTPMTFTEIIVNPNLKGHRLKIRDIFPE